MSNIQEKKHDPRDKSCGDTKPDPTRATGMNPFGHIIPHCQDSSAQSCSAITPSYSYAHDIVPPSLLHHGAAPGQLWDMLWAWHHARDNLRPGQEDWFGHSSSKSTSSSVVAPSARLPSAQPAESGTGALWAVLPAVPTPTWVMDEASLEFAALHMNTLKSLIDGM